MSKKELNIRVNPSIRPIYADELIEVISDSNCVKLLLAQRYDNEVIHTDTVVLPTDTFLYLKDYFEQRGQSAMVSPPMPKPKAK